MSQEYFSKHLSFSEWATQAKVSNRDVLIREDATKRKRLAFLGAAMGLPIVEARSFSFADVTAPSEQFSSFVAAAGSRPYALRANPRTEGLPVLRNRKLAVPHLVDWIISSAIDGDHYELSFEPHVDPELAAIFVVTDGRIVGEAIDGGILQLNKGLHSDDGAVRFEFDFASWRFSPASTSLAEFVETAVSYLRVAAPATRVVIENEMALGFSGDFLKGYFEVISSRDSGVVFIDYNRALVGTADHLSIAGSSPGHNDAIVGVSGCRGIARGYARVVAEDEALTAQIEDGEILVCRFTSPEFLSLITTAAAVVTDVGGILSHAAIVCRELGKPCVIGTRVGTQQIGSGDEIEVNGTNGSVRIVARRFRAT